ncbi:hypothetical protein ACHAWF_002105, partial [Thalassiosira exigua]
MVGALVFGTKGGWAVDGNGGDSCTWVAEVMRGVASSRRFDGAGTFGNRTASEKSAPYDPLEQRQRGCRSGRALGGLQLTLNQAIQLSGNVRKLYCEREIGAVRSAGTTAAGKLFGTCSRQAPVNFKLNSKGR